MKHGDGSLSFGLLINVREPVDRFVSAFDWYVTTHCQRNDSHHSVSTGGVNRMDLVAQCKPVPPNVDNDADIIDGHFHADANSLAEALCARGQEARAFAIESMATDVHMEYSLANRFSGLAGLLHLATLVQRAPEQRAVVAVPLAVGFDFLQLVDSALRFARDQKFGSRRVHRRLKLVQSAATMSHSSIALRHRSVLSPAGICCVAQHYREDYAVLATLANFRCHGDSAEACRAALLQLSKAQEAMLNATCTDLPRMEDTVATAA